jgi:hypothetical protein
MLKLNLPQEERLKNKGTVRAVFLCQQRMEGIYTLI